MESILLEVGLRAVLESRLIGGVACLDGAVHVWDSTKNFARPDRTGENAHEKNTETTSMAFSRDGRRLATRGGDDTVKRE